MKLPGGALFATVPFWPRNTRDLSTEVRTARSGDGGRTWESLRPLPYFTPCPWAHDRKLRQSFMYACPLIDGDDLLILSRTSRDGRDQHDADLSTFHRLPDFRRLALDLYPEG